MTPTPRYPQWKVDLFRNRERPCTCPLYIPGVTSERRSSTCYIHGWEGDPVAEEGRSITENEAIQKERRAR